MNKSFDDLVTQARAAAPAEAVALFARALALDPAQRRVLKELAAVAMRTEQRPAAIRVAEDCFRRCEGNPTLQLRIAFVLHSLGAVAAAVKGVLGLAASGVDPAACAKALNYVILGASPAAPESVEGMAMLLRHGYGSPKHGPLFSTAARIRLTAADGLSGDDAFLAAPLFGEPWFVEGLRAFVVMDRRLEEALTRLRSLFARRIGADGALDPDLIPLRPVLMALAAQCFVNEYVWDVSEEDEAQRARLAAILDATHRAGRDLNGARDAAAVLGCFASLYETPLAGALLIASPAVQDDGWAAVLRCQVEEPLRERTLAADIPALTPITDLVSRAVQDQYQENPYPRWIVASRPEPMPPPRPPGAAPRETGARMDVLVAGCGTGHHAIQVAEIYQGARVLAVDLSRASLAYAIRKTGERGIGRISYFQADILKLGRLGMKFDLIESAGVLHHLADPAAGLSVLAGLLKPDGMMRLALYSKIARAKILNAQALRAQQGIPATLEGIRSFRRQLFALPPEHPAAATQYPDIFSTSECRDLMFHVQETDYDIPEVMRLLAACGLTFDGFDNISRETEFQYRAAYPDDPAMKSPAHWDALERAHPDTFVGMYQFWAYKKQ